MSDQRYYVRFKGRVLGPLSGEKTAEMVKRGQITRQHELSPDGSTWSPAEQFEEFFPKRGSVTESSPSVRSTSSMVSDASPSEWYANFEGGNQGPVNESGIKSWIAAGKIASNTLVWRAGMPSWMEASTLHPEWFPRDGQPRGNHSGSGSHAGSLVASSASGEGSDLAGLAATAMETQSWTMFLSIFGIIVGVLGLFGTMIGFIAVASSPGSGPPKAFAISSSITQVIFMGFYTYIAVLLLRYTNKLSVLRFRATQGDFVSAFQALNRFWFALGVYVLVGLVMIIVLVSVMTALGLSVASMGIGE